MACYSNFGMADMIYYSAYYAVCIVHTSTSYLNGNIWCVKSGTILKKNICGCIPPCGGGIVIGNTFDITSCILKGNTNKCG